ncbi:MAG: response regulator [Alphaproteobacteria bacterium]|nr:response regulator [Alphaproteobacteria bacterium]
MSAEPTPKRPLDRQIHRQVLARPWTHGPVWATLVAVTVALMALIGLTDGLSRGPGPIEALALIALLGGSAVAIAYHMARSRAAVAEEQDLLRRSLDAVPQARVIADASGRVLYANPAYRWMCGPETAGSPDMPTLDALAALASGPQALDEIDRLRADARAGRAAMAEIPLRRVGRGGAGAAAAGGAIDGDTEWRAVAVYPIGPLRAGGARRERTPPPDAVLWLVDDVTERWRAEAAWRETEAQLADFLTELPVGLYSVDQDGRFRFANATFARWLGLTVEELVTRDLRLHDMLADPRPRGLPAHAPPLPAEGEERGVVRFIDRHGEVVSVRLLQTVGEPERPAGDGAAAARGGGDLVFASPTLGASDDLPDPTALLQPDAHGAADVRDGEPRRRRWTRSVVLRLGQQDWQEALRRSEQRFQRIFEEAPVGIVLVDARILVSAANRAFRDMARPRGRLVGQPLMTAIAAEDYPKIVERLDAVGAGAPALGPVEVRLAGDPAFEAAVYVARTEDVIGSPTGFILHFLDLTEQRRLEQQFAQSQRMQAVGQLAGGIAHDFNNLLTVMMGHSDFLLSRLRPGEQMFKDILEINQSAKRAATLVRQLLAFSRQQPLQPRVVAITDALADLSHLLRRLIGENIELRMVHERDAFHVRVDVGQLEQVLINLAVNARDAMNAGTGQGGGQGGGLGGGQGGADTKGGVLTIRTRNVAVEQPFERGGEEVPAGEYLAIEVSDTGTGIPPDIIDRIFEPFFSTKEVGSGTGLGLSTVYGIVKQSRGFVFVDSAIGEGSTFTIMLPRHIPTAEELDDARREGAEKPVAKDLTGSATILLVEDEDSVRSFSAKALRNKGYMVLEARSGEAALEELERAGGRIDLLITDVVMPQMDGPELIRKVRETRADMKVIFISGYAEDSFRQRLGDEGGIHFLPKPFTLKQLAGKVKDVIAAPGR